MDNAKRLKECEAAIAAELSKRNSSADYNWALVANQLARVQQEKLFTARATNFTEWIKLVSKECNVGNSSLWQMLHAREVFIRYSEQSEASITFEEAGKISKAIVFVEIAGAASKDPAKEKGLIDDYFSKRLTLKDIRNMRKKTNENIAAAKKVVRASNEKGRNASSKKFWGKDYERWSDSKKANAWLSLYAAIGNGKFLDEIDGHGSSSCRMYVRSQDPQSPIVLAEATETGANLHAVVTSTRDASCVAGIANLDSDMLPLFDLYDFVYVCVQASDILSLADDVDDCYALAEHWAPSSIGLLVLDSACNDLKLLKPAPRNMAEARVTTLEWVLHEELTLHGSVTYAIVDL